MTYKDYNFSPVPLMTIEKGFDRTGDDTIIGISFTVQLQGILTPLPSSSPGYVNVDALQDELRSGLNEDGHLFKVSCNNNTILEAHPKVLSINFDTSSDNWTEKTPYVIQLQFNDEPTSSGENVFDQYISSADESWNIEFNNDNSKYKWDLNGTQDTNPISIRLTHNLNAIGKRQFICETGATGILTKQAWEQARDWVIPKLGLKTEHISSSGVINLDVNNFGSGNHMRIVNIGELEGSYNVSETWLIYETGVTGLILDAIEDFTVESRKSLDTDLTTISVNGQIQGIEQRNYGTLPGDFSITQTKDDSAESYWNSVKGKLYGRVQRISDASRTIHTDPVEETVGRNPTKGIITYSYSYNDRPCNIISNARSESVTISDIHHTDIVASLFVLGSKSGPVLQDLGTPTNAERRINIEAVVPVPTGCSGTDLINSINAAPTGDVETFLCTIYSNLSGSYDQVFKTQDESSWDFKMGRYSRSTTFLYSNCSGNFKTGFC